MNFHNEITKLQERVATIEGKLDDEKVPDHLKPAKEGLIEVPGAAKPPAPEKPAESQPGTPVAKVETKPEAKAWTDAGDGTDYPDGGVEATPSSPKAEEAAA